MRSMMKLKSHNLNLENYPVKMKEKIMLKQLQKLPRKMKI